jgi:hypothetical protein
MEVKTGNMADTVIHVVEFVHPYTRKTIKLHRDFFIQKQEKLFRVWDYEEIDTLELFVTAFSAIREKQTEITKHPCYLDNLNNLEAAIDYYHYTILDRYANWYIKSDLEDNPKLVNKGLKALVREGMAVDKYETFDDLPPKELEEVDLFMGKLRDQMWADALRDNQMVSMPIEFVKHYKNSDVETATADEIYIRDVLYNNNNNNGQIKLMQ